MRKEIVIQYIANNRTGPEGDVVLTNNGNLFTWQCGLDEEDSKNGHNCGWIPMIKPDFTKKKQV